MSETIIISKHNSTLSTDNNKLTYKLPTGQKFHHMQMCMSSLFIYNSWNNITTVFANTELSYTWHDATVNTISITPGYYTISDIEGFIQLTMKDNGHYLVDENGADYYYIILDDNPVYYGTTITCRVIPTALPTNYTNPGSMAFPGTASVALFTVPAFTVNSTLGFGLLIGFSAGTYPAVTQTTAYQVHSDLIPKIHPVEDVLVTCNLVNNGKYHVQDNVLHTFTATVSVGSQIVITPPEFIWYNILENTYNEITIQFLDQSYTPLIILDDSLQIGLTLKHSPHTDHNYKEII